MREHDHKLTGAKPWGYAHTQLGVGKKDTMRLKCSIVLLLAALTAGCLSPAPKPLLPPRVITPTNRHDIPGKLSLHVIAGMAASTFIVEYTPPETAFGGVRSFEVFEPESSTAESPFADHGVAKIRIAHTPTHNVQGVLEVDFTYPTARLQRAFLRINMLTGETYVISLWAFRMMPDPSAIDPHSNMLEYK